MVQDKKVQSFLKSCKEKNVLLIHDSDLDGTCSGIITYKALKQNKCNITRIAADRGKLQEYINENPTFNFIVILDQAPNALKLTKEKKVLVIDHHQGDDISSSKIVHINPTFKKKVYQPTSYLAYKIFSEFFDLSKIEWVAVLGTTADYAYDDVKDLMDKHMTVDNREEIWETSFGKAAHVLDGAAIDIGYERLFDAMLSGKDLDSVLIHPEIKAAYKNYTIEYQRCKKIAMQSIENIGPIMFARVSSKYKGGVASHISMELNKEYPKKIILVTQKMDDMVKISARTHREDINLGQLMKKASAGIGQGGGHAPAAGASVAESKYDKFKERIIKMVQG